MFIYSQSLHVLVVSASPGSASNSTADEVINPPSANILVLPNDSEMGDNSCAKVNRSSSCTSHMIQAANGNRASRKQHKMVTLSLPLSTRPATVTVEVEESASYVLM